MQRGRRRRRTGPICLANEVVLRIEEPERARGSIRITKHLAQKMEWVPGETRIRVEVDAETGRIVLSEDPKGCGFRQDRRIHFAYAPELSWQIFGDGSCRLPTTHVGAVNVQTSVETVISLNISQQEEQVSLLVPLLPERQEDPTILPMTVHQPLDQTTSGEDRPSDQSFVSSPDEEESSVNGAERENIEAQCCL